MPYCPKCGFQVNEDMHFCPQCGASLQPLSIDPKPAQTSEPRQHMQHSARYLQIRRGVLILVSFGIFSVLIRSIPFLIALVRGAPLQLNFYTSSTMVFDIIVIMVSIVIVVWWSRGKFWLDEPLEKRSFPRTIDVVLLTLGALLFGFVFGINFYADTWGFNNVIFVPSRDLNVNSAAGSIYELVLGIGMILFLVGYLNMCLKGNRVVS